MQRISPLLVVAALGLPGCFYTEQINQRPSIDIGAPGHEVYRGDTVSLTAIASDPEGQVIAFTWRAYACTDGTGGADCDTEPFYSDVLDHAAFKVPLVRADVALPVRNIRVLLEAKDELGATAKPVQELVIVALDRPPSVIVAPEASFVMTPGRAIKLFATISDLDDGPQVLGAPKWEVFAPSQVAYTLEDKGVVTDPTDATHLTYVKVLTPSAIGTWEVRVTATDPLDVSTMDSAFLEVVNPPPPCLAQYQPIVPPAGSALPISDPTLFRVPVVIDDLDVYPPAPEDPTLGVTRFQWSVMAPGGATHAAVVGATANTFALDPANYTPGDVIEVRVEIFDRQNTPIPCPDTDATCSTISLPSCIQRQTWRVEVQ